MIFCSYRYNYIKYNNYVYFDDVEINDFWCKLSLYSCGYCYINFYCYYYCSNIWVFVVDNVLKKIES